MNQILQGDCLEILATLPDNFIDALITDPPAGIAFMGRSWDKDKGGMLEWVNWLSEVMAECLRCLKPGGVGVVWSIPRTCGWTQLALELSGFRVVDSIAIINGSGFPKGQDVAKHLQKIDPNHPEIERWDGWKTPALKPSHETWFLVQKPIDERNIARNVLKWGVGGLNIEAARIETVPRSTHKDGNIRGANIYSGGFSVNTLEPGAPNRYPANTILIHSPECTDAGCVEHCPVEIMGRQSGVTTTHGGGTVRTPSSTEAFKSFGFKAQPADQRFNGDTGTAARYFKQLPFDHDGFHYFTKASRRDRNSGIENKLMLRNDLTPEEKEYVLAELKAYGVDL